MCVASRIYKGDTFSNQKKKQRERTRFAHKPSSKLPSLHVSVLLLLFLLYTPSFISHLWLRTVSTTALKEYGSVTAISARTLRLRVMLARFNPGINLE